MNIVLLGLPGSGKGSLALKLKEGQKLSHISTGDVLRKEVREKTSLGLKIKSIIDRGELVSDDIMIDLIKSSTSKLHPPFDKGFVLDGFPRTYEQAIALENIFEIDCAILLNIEKEFLIERLKGRRTCPQCGSLYNIFYKKPQKENICDKCQSTLTLRQDDQDESVISSRLKNFKDNNQSLKEYYQKKNRLIEIDGAKNSDEVYKIYINHL